MGDRVPGYGAVAPTGCAWMVDKQAWMIDFVQNGEKLLGTDDLSEAQRHALATEVAVLKNSNNPHGRQPCTVEEFLAELCQDEAE